MFILPSIDLRHGKVVRLRQGDYTAQLSYDVDPVASAHEFAAQGAEHLHVVDLDGAKEGRPVQTALVARIIAAVPAVQVQAGGGVRSESDLQSLLAAGAKRVVIGTRAVNDLPWLRELLDQEQFQNRIVLALDAKDGVVATHGWLQTSGQRVSDIARLVNSWPLAALLYTDVAKDGMLGGPNFEQTHRLADSTKLPVIASGGVGTLEHVRQLAKTGCWGAVVGRCLYDRVIGLEEVIAAAGEPG